MLVNKEKLRELLCTTDLINQKFETVGAYIGDQLMLFELCANILVSDPIKLQILTDQYAEDIDDKLSHCKTKLITDIAELNSRLFTNVNNYRK